MGREKGADDRDREEGIRDKEGTSDENEKKCVCATYEAGFREPHITYSICISSA